MLNRDFQFPNTGPCPWLSDWLKSDIFAYRIPAQSAIPIGAQSFILLRNDRKYHGYQFILISINYPQTFQQSMSDYLMSCTLTVVIYVRDEVVSIHLSMFAILSISPFFLFWKR